jgi:hypothetical protein
VEESWDEKMAQLNVWGNEISDSSGLVSVIHQDSSVDFGNDGRLSRFGETRGDANGVD